MPVSPAPKAAVQAVADMDVREGIPISVHVTEEYAPS
jgi:hypothetical protein